MPAAVSELTATIHAEIVKKVLGTDADAIREALKVEVPEDDLLKHTLKSKPQLKPYEAAVKDFINSLKPRAGAVK